MGTTEPNYTANIKITPALTMPEGKTLSAKADIKGEFEFLVDFPVNSGRYALVIQGQNDKVLTPESEPIYFEISQAKGGQINILTSSDEKEPVIPPVPEKKWYEKINYLISTYVFAALFLAVLVILLLVVFKNKKTLKIIKGLSSFK
jgi:hypothetical protein